MNRYLLFGYENYYPSGGMEDMIVQFNTVEEIVEHFKTNTDYGFDIERNDNYQLVDTMDNFSYKTYEVNRYDSDLDDIDILKIDELLEEKLIDWIKSCIK